MNKVNSQLALASLTLGIIALLKLQGHFCADHHQLLSLWVMRTAGVSGKCGMLKHFYSVNNGRQFHRVVYKFHICALDMTFTKWKKREEKRLLSTHEPSLSTSCPEQKSMSKGHSQGHSHSVCSIRLQFRHRRSYCQDINMSLNTGITEYK